MALVPFWWPSLTALEKGFLFGVLLTVRYEGHGAAVVSRSQDPTVALIVRWPVQDQSRCSTGGKDERAQGHF